MWPCDARFELCFACCCCQQCPVGYGVTATGIRWSICLRAVTAHPTVQKGNESQHSQCSLCGRFVCGVALQEFSLGLDCSRACHVVFLPWQGLSRVFRVTLCRWKSNVHGSAISQCWPSLEQRCSACLQVAQTTPMWKQYNTPGHLQTLYLVKSSTGDPLNMSDGGYQHERPRQTPHVQRRRQHRCRCNVPCPHQPHQLHASPMHRPGPAQVQPGRSSQYAEANELKHPLPSHHRSLPKLNASWTHRRTCHPHSQLRSCRFNTPEILYQCCILHTGSKAIRIILGPTHSAGISPNGPAQPQTPPSSVAALGKQGPRHAIPRA